MFSDDLPDEILVMILGLLPTAEDIIRCSRVSHRWHRLSTEETVWRSTKIKEFTAIPLKSLAKLIQQGIRKLDLSNVVVSSLYYSFDCQFYLL